MSSPFAVIFQYALAYIVYSALGMWYFSPAGFLEMWQTDHPAEYHARPDRPLGTAFLSGLFTAVVQYKWVDYIFDESSFLDGAWWLILTFVAINVAPRLTSDLFAGTTLRTIYSLFIFDGITLALFVLINQLLD